MTVLPYVPIGPAYATVPAETDFTLVPAGALIPIPFQRVVVLLGFTNRPNLYRNAPSTGQSSLPMSVVRIELGANVTGPPRAPALRRSDSKDAIRLFRRASLFSSSASRALVRLVSSCTRA